jgi:hypothetical protein
MKVFSKEICKTKTMQKQQITEELGLVSVGGGSKNLSVTQTKKNIWMVVVDLNSPVHINFFRSLSGKIHGKFL